MAEYITEGTVDMVPRSITQHMMELLGDSPELSNAELLALLEDSGYEIGIRTLPVLAARARRRLGIRRVRVKGT